MTYNTPYICDLIKIAAKKSDTKAPGPIKVNEKRPILARPLSSTLGRLGGTATGTLLGDTAYFKRSATKADIEKHLRKYNEGEGIKSSKKKGAIPLEIHAGGVRPAKDLKRIWSRKDIGPISKTFNTGATLAASPLRALVRDDKYDAGAHSITAHHKSRASLAREIGRAKDFNRVTPKAQALYRAAGMLPLVNTYQHAKASRNATKDLSRGKGAAKLKPGQISSDDRKLTAYTSLSLPSPAVLAAGHLLGKTVGVMRQQDK